MPYGPHLKNIMGIAVSSNFRRNGIGKMLLIV
jgi:ribosomal protein S18 acetylase RimI-like enzyme